MEMPVQDYIKSVSYDQTEIIKNIIKLHCKDGIECDPTLSRGGFYKNIEKPKYMFDIIPRYDYVKKHDCRELPFKDSTIKSIMFDPPFLATKGQSLGINDNSNLIPKRFGVFPDEKSLHRFYIESLQEFYRVLDKNGILIFKCQDKVSSGKQYFSHCFVLNEALKAGFYAKDLFILLAKNRIIADWQTKQQKHSRKYHSYFWVFQKTPLTISYL